MSQSGEPLMMGRIGSYICLALTRTYAYIVDDCKKGVVEAQAYMMSWPEHWVVEVES